MSRSLVLNASFEPLGTIPSRRAVVLVLTEKAITVHETGDVFRSERLVLALPSVVRLRQYVHLPHRREEPDELVTEDRLARTVDPVDGDHDPLTRQHRTDPRLAERWDLVAFGTELGTAYSELIDPVEQRKRLTEQSLLAAGGDPEAMEVDEDFLGALEYGMPPTGGLGIGVDRLVMFLTGLTIREIF